MRVIILCSGSVLVIARSYVAVAWGGLSKPALMCWAPGAAPRSHSRKLDAVGRHDRSVPLPICARRLSDDLTEGSAECPDAAEADVEADVGHSAVTLAEQKHRTLDLASLQVAVG